MLAPTLAHPFFFFFMGILEEISFHTEIEIQQSQEERDYIRSSLRIFKIQGGGIPFQILDWPEDLASFARV